MSNYRAGRYAEAVQRLNEAAAKHGKGGSAVTQLFLSLAHHRLARQTAAPRTLGLLATPLGRGPLLALPTLPGADLHARRFLAQAIQQIEQTKAPSWQQEVRWRCLCREAEALLASPFAAGR